MYYTVMGLYNTVNGQKYLFYHEANGAVIGSSTNKLCGFFRDAFSEFQFPLQG